MEVRLCGAAVAERNFRQQRCGQSPGNSAFNQVGDVIGIQRIAAVNGADDAVNGDEAITNRDLGDLRHERSERFAEGDPPRSASGWRVSPTRPDSCHIEHCQRTRVACEQCAPVIHRIAARSLRQFVDEALKGE